MNNFNKLKVQKIIKTYNKRSVVRGVSLEVNRGEIIGLLGPNGAGKTTTFYMITGMINPNKGHVFLDNLDITSDPMYKRARKGIGYLAQEPSIFGKLTVAENLELVLQMRNDLSAKDQKKKAKDLLEDFSVFHLSDNKGNALSGGERRRVEMARSLCMDPDFILLDEPFAGVDPISVSDIKQIISRLKEQNIGILLTDHNVRETLDICERAYIVSEGVIIAQGQTRDILSNQKVREVYLGEQFKA